MVLLAGSRIQVTWSGGGKSSIPGGLHQLSIRLPNSLLATSNMEYFNIAICKTWSLEWNLRDLKFRMDFEITVCKLGNFERNWRFQYLNLAKLFLKAWWPPRRPADTYIYIRILICAWYEYLDLYTFIYLYSYFQMHGSLRSYIHIYIYIFIFPS